MKTVWIHLLLILLLFGCAQTGQKTSITVHSDNSQAQAADLQQAMLKQARTFRQSHPELLGEAKGVLVIDVESGTQAEKAGLQSGDILLTHDDTFLNSYEHLIELHVTKADNEAVTLTYLRNRELHNAALKGGKIGFLIGSLIPSEAELSTQQMQLLRERGNKAYRQSHSREALQHFKQGLEIASAQKQKDWQSNFQGYLGLVYQSLGEYSQALNYHQQSLFIARQISDRKGEAYSLLNLGSVYFHLSLYPQALDYYLQSLNIYREIGDSIGEASSLTNLGDAYRVLGQYKQALDYHQQSLAIMRDLNMRKGEAYSLLNLGSVYFHLSLYPQALDYYLQSLYIYRESGDRNGEASSLNNASNVYKVLGQNPQALDYYLQSVSIYREIGDRNGEASSLNNLGSMYESLGQYPQALDFLQQSLAIKNEIGDRNGEADSLNNLGNVYRVLGQYPQALDYLQQSLAIKNEIGDRKGEAISLNNLGSVYRVLGQYPQALDYYQQSLVINRELGDRDGEANSLGNLGNMYRVLGQYPQALDAYRKAANTFTHIKVPESLWRAWYGISIASYRLDQIHAAILAGKQAVNTLQGLRTGNLTLQQNLQQSFLVDKTFVYHRLAKILIEQGRLAEAEQVMAMLKEEEYFDFIQRDSKDDTRTTQVGYTQVEKGIIKQIVQFSTQLVSRGKEYDRLTHLSQIDDQAKTRLAEVEKELEHAQDQFLNVLSSLEGYFKQVGGDRAVEFGERQLAQLERQQDLLRRHQSVIVTTVATKDKLHLILTTPEVQLARESAITEKDLNDLVKRFRNALKHPGSNPVPLAQELYDHLVKPLEKDLQQTQAKTLMWSLDGVLRYIPLATLHDGQQFLIEKYNLSLYTAAAQNNLYENNVSAWRVAGLGVSQAHPGFEALPSVPNELRNIIRQNDNDLLGVLPGEIHLDQAFNRDSFKSVIRAGFPVLHIASHFKLQPGDGSLSTLLLGDGDLLSIDEFRRQAAFKLHGVDLLTLSACDTAVGDKGTGGEVESFAVMAQLRGANGVLASLWRVEDESTGLLMKRLYRLRSENMQLSKAEALRRAQIAMLKGDLKAKEGGHDFRHPYFWAPFVMMGNWL
ncbi:tetratricopeptide repeat protein [Nitrosomonas ureae]|uniref:CHAT domain-containing protein n=1 Tax=Nitrosomonas ureae TaxID=44577 RepID=A0A1H9A0W0_9PROT|nr:tetratricopeptide repeat protein [Nitrosomonas ureae]SEP70245.1 CHAT domain-containing protein [Nitrosomonas ureae]